MAARKTWCAGHQKEHVETAFASSRSTVCKKWTKERIARDNRAKRLKKQYGLTLEEYDALFAAQDGRCAICNGERRYNLHVDHDHKRQRDLIKSGVGEEDAARLSVRGLLCARCNKLLRDARDNEALFEGALSYLAHPPARLVIAA